MALFNALAATLRARFADRGLRPGTPPDLVMIIPGIHPDVGDVVIEADDGDIVVTLGVFTHAHFNLFDDGSSVAERDERVVASVIEFLDDLFADRVVMWGSHKGGGGCFDKDNAVQMEHAEKTAGQCGIDFEHHYVWSGPLRR